MVYKVPPPVRPVHQFTESDRKGQPVEAAIGKLLQQSGHYRTVVAASLVEQRSGLDWRAESWEGSIVTFQIKADYRSIATGNVFVELMSAAPTARIDQGWAIALAADWLIYCIVNAPRDRAEALWLRPHTVRAALAQWLLKYRSQAISNTTHSTIGLLVPLGEFRDRAEYITTITV